MRVIVNFLCVIVSESINLSVAVFPLINVDDLILCLCVGEEPVTARAGVVFLISCFCTACSKTANLGYAVGVTGRHLCVEARSTLESTICKCVCLTRAFKFKCTSLYTADCPVVSRIISLLPCACIVVVVKNYTAAFTAVKTIVTLGASSCASLALETVSADYRAVFANVAFGAKEGTSSAVAFTYRALYKVVAVVAVPVLVEITVADATFNAVSTAFTESYARVALSATVAECAVVGASRVTAATDAGYIYTQGNTVFAVIVGCTHPVVCTFNTCAATTADTGACVTRFAADGTNFYFIFTAAVADGYELAV